MSIIIPHRTSYSRHTNVPYLWRGKCSCGWSVYAPDEEKILMACDQHKIEEDPFPDMGLELPEDLR